MFYQFVPMGIWLPSSYCFKYPNAWTVSNVQNCSTSTYSGHFQPYHLHGLDQTVMTWVCLRRFCSDYHIGDQPGALNQDQSYNMININVIIKMPSCMVVFNIWETFTKTILGNESNLLQRWHHVMLAFNIWRLLPVKTETILGNLNLN